MIGKIGKTGLLKGKIATVKAMSNAGMRMGQAGRVAGKNLGKAGVVLKDTAKHNVKQTLKSTANIASSFIKEDNKGSLLGYRVKGSGVALLAGAGVAGTVAKETKDHFTQDMKGRQDGHTTSYSPSMQQAGQGYGNYGKQAGATGDLVFALNKNRLG